MSNDLIDSKRVKTDPRASRDFGERQFAERPKQWQRPDLLPDPDPMPGYSFRWVRAASMNTPDARNMSSKLREGWEPVTVEDQPKFRLISPKTGEFKGLVEVGGLLLCKMPTEFVNQRRAYYRNLTQNQTDGIVNDYFRENDPRAPVFHEGKTKVSKFGNG